MPIAILTLILAVATGTSPEHTVSRVEAGITYSLTANQAVYPRFEPIEVSYTVTNNREEPVTFSFDSAEQTIVRIYPASCATLDQTGCLALAIFDFPQVVHFNATQFTLAPGAAQTITTLWDQRRNTGNTPSDGDYRLLGALLAASPTGGLTAIPGTELSLPLTIGDITTPAETESWSRIKAFYR